MKNKYVFRSRISEHTFRHIIKLFCLDIEASKIAEITGVSEHSLNKLFKALRERILDLCEAEAVCHESTFECDESYFGPHRIRGIRGRGAKRKTIVFGIYDRRAQHVYLRIVNGVTSKHLIPIIERIATKASTIYTDDFSSYRCLKTLGYAAHEVVEHTDNEFARKEVHTNGIENFWGLVKTSLTKRKGFRGESLLFHLKECEYRFNHGGAENMYHDLLQNMRNLPLKFN